MVEIDSKTIEELRGLAEKATPGPWSRQTLEPSTLGHEWIDAPTGRYVAVCHELLKRNEGGPAILRPDLDEVAANTALIVAMRNALPALLDLATASLEREGEDGTSLEGQIAEAFRQFCIHDWNRPAWWSSEDTDRFVKRLAARLRALTAENEALRRERDEAREKSFFNDNLKTSERWLAAETRAKSSEALVAELREKVEKALNEIQQQAEAEERESDYDMTSILCIVRRARSELEGR